MYLLMQYRPHVIRMDGFSAIAVHSREAIHDSRTFKSLYDKIKGIGIETLIGDAGYKTPGIAKLLIDQGSQTAPAIQTPPDKRGFLQEIRVRL